MAQTVTTQMNEFRRLDDGRIVLDGLVWSQYAEKAIEVTDPDNGFKVFNIKLDGVSYYPVGYDRRKKKQYMERLIMIVMITAFGFALWGVDSIITKFENKKKNKQDGSVL